MVLFSPNFQLKTNGIVDTKCKLYLKLFQNKIIRLYIINFDSWMKANQKSFSSFRNKQNLLKYFVLNFNSFKFNSLK